MRVYNMVPYYTCKIIGEICVCSNLGDRESPRCRTCAVYIEWKETGELLPYGGKGSQL